MGRFDRTSKKFKEFELPVSAAGPIVMRAETVAKNGDHFLWFACVVAGSVAGINTRTGQIVVHKEPTVASNAVEIAQDLNNNVWISHITYNALGVLNPQTGNLTEIIMPGTISDTPISVPLYGGSGLFSKPVGDPTFGQKGLGHYMYFTQLTKNRLVKFNFGGMKF